MFEEAKIPKNIGKYQILKTVESGLSKIKLVRDTVSGKQYVAKICKDKPKETMLEKEAKILEDLGQLGMPNIIKFIEFFKNDDTSMRTFSQKDATLKYQFKAAIIMEFAINGTLFDEISKHGKLEEKLARTYFIRLIKTVQELHTNNYVHRDLKPENILLDKRFQLKLIDFGFTKTFNQDNKNKMLTKLGTESYMAPELFQSKPYSGIKTDSFACGVLLFIFIFGRPPFFKASALDPIYKNIVQNKLEKFWAPFEEKLNDGKVFDSNLKLIITDLLKYKVEERAEIGNLWEYEWMKGEIYTEEELLQAMEQRKQTGK